MNGRNTRAVLTLFLLCAILGTCGAAVALPGRQLSGVVYELEAPTDAPGPPDPGPGLEGVPLYEQPTLESCGETAFVMDWNYTHPDTPLNLTSVISNATRQGWYLPGDPAKVFTSPAHMADMANYYAAHNNIPEAEVGRVTGSQEGWMLLFSRMMLGQPVVVDVTTVMGDTGSAAHFVVVTGVSLIDGEIYYNDPYGYIALGEHEPAQQHADWDIFWHSWSENGDAGGQGNGWYMIVK
jgi:hypothetical protein